MPTEEMGPWKSAVLESILAAVAGDPRLRGMLVFKGGRVLALRLGKSRRQSLDIDSNLRPEVVAGQPDREALRSELETLIDRAVRREFQAQVVIRFELERVRVLMKLPAW